jgi:REP element-mobilizing transposase RayT
LQLESYLDQGRGECLLRRPDIAQLIEQTLRFYHPQRYGLRAWVIMPNHLHLLRKIDQIPVAKILHNFKRYTVRETNLVLKRRGSFWCEDYFDTYRRDAPHELRTCRYIENNPVKAKLVVDPKSWPSSSARFRDDYGALHL